MFTEMLETRGNETVRLRVREAASFHLESRGPVVGGALRGVLGIDPSLASTGFCLMTPENIGGSSILVRLWTAGANLKKGATAWEKQARLHLLAEHAAVSWGTGAQHVGMEGAVFAKFAANDLGELRGVMKEKLMFGCSPPPEVHLVAPLSARKTLLGRGTKGKGPVGAYLKARWGVDLPGTDMDDAFAVANHVWAKVNGWGYGPTQQELDGLAKALGNGRKS
jgi:Holliday junction resolvasome RuvABC endonuclease subunit